VTARLDVAPMMTVPVDGGAAPLMGQPWSEGRVAEQVDLAGIIDQTAALHAAETRHIAVPICRKLLWSESSTL